MLSPKPWKPEAVLRLLLGIFMCLAIGALLILLLVVPAWRAWQRRQRATALSAGRG